MFKIEDATPNEPRTRVFTIEGTEGDFEEMNEILDILLRSRTPALAVDDKAKFTQFATRFNAAIEW